MPYPLRTGDSMSLKLLKVLNVLYMATSIEDIDNRLYATLGALLTGR